MNLQSEPTFNTTPGGIASIMLVLVIIWLIITQTVTMFSNGNSTITENETLANFTTIGEIKMSDYKYLPIIRIFKDSTGIEPSE